MHLSDRTMERYVVTIMKDRWPEEEKETREATRELLKMPRRQDIFELAMDSRRRVIRRYVTELKAKHKQCVELTM